MTNVRFDVVIIGLGLAGLSAGIALQRSGLSVIALEARRDAGGRVRSVRDHVTGMEVDLGGELIASYHQRVHAWCRACKLKLQPSFSDAQAPLLPASVYLAGELVPRRMIEMLEAELRKLIIDLVELSANVGHSGQSQDGSETELGEVTVEDWLEHHGVTPELRILFSDLAPGTQSMLGLLALVRGGRGFPFFYESERFTISGGTTGLVTAMKRRLKCEVKFETPAVRLWKDGSDVVVQCDNSNANHYYSTKSVVVTTPPPTWPVMEPSLQSPIAPFAALSNNRKLTLFVAPPPRLRVKAERPVSCLTDRPCRILSRASVPGTSFERIDVLVSPFLDPSEVEADQIRYALRTFGCPPDSVRSAHTKDWERARWSRGSYAVFGPGVVDGDGGKLWDRTGPMFFAGDYVLPEYAGYMEGALRSGAMAADSALRFLLAKR